MLDAVAQGQVFLCPMRKLYNLKNWYSLEDAAKRLTVTLGEDFSVNDLLGMVIEGHVPLSWNMRRVPALALAPYTKICNWDTSLQSIFATMGMEQKPALKPGQLETMACLNDYEEEAEYLEGAHKLELEMCGAIKEWVLSLITSTGGKLISLEGYIVADSQGCLWRVMERFTTEELEAKQKALNFPPPPTFGYRKPINHRSYFYPSGKPPNPADLGITRQDLETVSKVCSVTGCQ